jgi:hypothetical protein
MNKELEDDKRENRCKILQTMENLALDWFLPAWSAGRSRVKIQKTP